MDETTTYEEVPTEEETENTTTSSGLDGFDIMGIILIATICIVVIVKVFHKTFGRFKITSKWFNFEDLKESE
jgi:hypothetical protein